MDVLSILTRSLSLPGRRNQVHCGLAASSRTALLLLAVVGSALSSPAWSRTAFYYGPSPPVAELSAYDRVVLEPSLVTPAEVAALTAAGAAVHAYVSVGEIETDDPLYASLPPDAVPGTNPAWQTKVADLTHPAWRRHIVEGKIAPLGGRGFAGAFLDTLDSHHLLPDVGRQRDALASIISEVQGRYPGLSLILNRGFEVLQDLQAPVAGLAVESLFNGWDAGTGSYRAVPEPDRAWLLARLKEAEAYADEIVVIDYLPHADQQQREALARQIVDLGYAPWVAEPALTDLGTSDLVPVPRRILVIHAESDAPLTERDVHVMFGVVFDWLGYVVEYHDIRSGPPQLIQGVHAGVVSWLDEGTTERLSWFEDWLVGVVDSGFRLVMLATLPSVADALLDRLGLAPAVARKAPVAVGVVGEPELVGTFEAPLRVRKHQVPPVRSVGADNDVDLVIELDSGQSVTAVVTGPWGGMALQPYLVEDYGQGRRRWLLDPYRFLALALGHTPRPVFDTTTESGNRLLTVHVDGDGFPSRAFLPGSPLSAAVLLEEFITTYDLPHTVSVIEGEVGAAGLYPEQAPLLEAAARKIFSAHNVEIASHSFSHPFYWRPDSLTADQPTEYGMNLPIPDYQMTLEREIAGSIDYINERLAPAGKQVQVFLWTGAADPDDRALAMLEARGVLNVNGGNTHLLDADASRLLVWPQARLENGAIQVYAAAMNENVYTNNWTGPFYGYRRAIETFELTDQPRRLKPIGIYYHFYSATKPASIRALHEVYNWALSREVLPIYLSGFARRVEAFHRAWLCRDLDGNWVAGAAGALRTLRLPRSLGYAQPLDPGSMAGQRRINDDVYLHLTGDSIRFALGAVLPDGVWLEQANAHVLRWEADAGSVDLRLSGSRPIRFSVRSAERCRLLLASGEEVPGLRSDAVQAFSLEHRDTGDARLVCR